MIYWTAKHTHNKSYIIKKATHRKLMHDNDKHQIRKQGYMKSSSKRKLGKLSSW